MLVAAWRRSRCVSYIRTTDGRLWWDTFRLRVPLLGDALRKAETSRFARAMGTLVGNSVPLVQSISISGSILNNRRIARRSKLCPGRETRRRHCWTVVARR